MCIVQTTYFFEYVNQPHFFTVLLIIVMVILSRCKPISRWLFHLRGHIILVFDLLCDSFDAKV